VPGGLPAGAFLGDREDCAFDAPDAAFPAARAAAGPIAPLERTTFELRARVTSGEAWAAAVVLVGGHVGPGTPPPDLPGIALVSAAPIHGPSSRLAPEGAGWVLRPAGLRIQPIRLVPDDIAAIAELAAAAGRPLAIDLDDD